MSKFMHGDRVKLIHKDNPFKGEEGEFSEYEKPCYPSERERLIVILDSDKIEHFFYKDEVISVEKVIKVGILDEKTIGMATAFEGLKFPGKVYLLTFEWNGKMVGTLEMKGKKLHFEGDADFSASLLFNKLQGFVEQYIEKSLKGK